jgi:hypothetical protein
MRVLSGGFFKKGVMKINIGTSKGNIVGFEIDKTFNQLKYEDIRKIVDQEKGSGATVFGWAPTEE